MRINVFILIFSIVFFQSCSKSNAKIKDVETYITNNLNAKINNKVFVIFSINSCHACVDKILELLDREELIKNTTIILSGYSKKQLKISFNKIPIGIEVLYDLENSNFAKKYLTSSKSIIYSKKENIFLHFDYTEVDEALLYLESL